MSRLAKAYIRLADGMVNRMGSLAGWITLLLVLVVVYDVVMRYSFQTTTAAIIEIEWHLFSLIFLLGISYGLQHDRHVRVDVFYHRWSPARQAWVNLLGQALFVLPFAAVLLRSALKFTRNSWLIRETSPNPDGLPAWYVIKGAMALAAALLLLQALAELLRQVLRLRGLLPYPQNNESHA